MTVVRAASDVVGRSSVGTHGAAVDVSPELPAWPVVLLLWGMPLWWVLGLLPFVSFGMLVVLGFFLIGTRRVVLLPGTLPLCALACWMLACAVMLDSAMRLVGFGFRWAMLAAAAVTLLYIVNCRATDRVLLSGVAVIGALVIAGGWLGLLVPHGGFETPVARLMPSVLWSNEMVRDLLGVRFAEVQQPWGAGEAFRRPSAPFPYTNGWGCAIALLAPLLLAWREIAGPPWARIAVWLGLLAALAPAIATRNRGMLLILGVVVVAQLAGLVRRGDHTRFALLGTSAAAAAAGFVALGGWQLIEERQSYGDTTAGRASIYAETWSAVLSSPVLGFGAPRPSQEIGISLGTQGAWWTLLFSFGFVGAGLFLAFLLRVLGSTHAVACAGVRTDGLWLHSALVGAMAAGFFYGFDIIHLLLIVVSAGILLRRRAGQGAP